jgi:uncharacterized repeat protein (TIGR03803 family)
MAKTAKHENWILRWRAMSALAVTLCIALLQLVVGATAQAQTYAFSVLYSFTGIPDGASSAAGLALDGHGILFGTTQYGGASNEGTVFKLDGKGNESVLHSFCSQRNCTDGAFPSAGLMLDSQGNLYGTTDQGGANYNGFYGAGTVFEVSSTGTETVLYSFCSKAKCTDGSEPSAGLVMDAQGNLYGTTSSGGGSSRACGNLPCGTVFRVSRAHGESKETRLYSFTGKSDGGKPRASLLRDTHGNLYGTSFFASGTVFRVSLVAGKWTQTGLYDFSGGTDGGPSAGLIMDAQGNLYGTTSGGGTYDAGTVFKLDMSGNETILHSFSGTNGDGSYPLAALVLDGRGNLYGTTIAGGDTSCDAPSGCGMVFKLDTNGNETVLHSFSGGADGSFPYAGLVLDGQGNLYGTTFNGGLNTCTNEASGEGCGVVFKLTP